MLVKAPPLVMGETLHEPQELARTARSLLDWHVSMHCNVLPMCAMCESKIASCGPPKTPRATGVNRSGRRGSIRACGQWEAARIVVT